MRLYEPWQYAKTLGAKLIHLYKIVADLDTIKQALENNIAVRPYTINDKTQLNQFINSHCSGIIMHYPERALSILHDVQDN